MLLQIASTLQIPSIRRSLHVLVKLHLQTGTLRPGSLLGIMVKNLLNKLQSFLSFDIWLQPSGNLKLAVKSFSSTGCPFKYKYKYKYLCEFKTSSKEFPLNRLPMQRLPTRGTQKGLTCENVSLFASQSHKQPVDSYEC